MAKSSTIPYESSLDTVNKIYTNALPGVESTLNGADVTTDTISEIFQSAQGAKYKIVHNADGTIRYYTVDMTEKIDGIGSAIDSNIGQGAKMTSQIPLNTVADETKKVTFKGGLATAGKFVTTEIIPAVTAVGTGIALGKTIDTLLYKANPDFWDAHGMSMLNPDTWNSITSDSDTLGTRVFNAILGINQETKESQQYLDENALAYLAYYMQTKGVFNKGKQTATIDDTTGLHDDTIEALPVNLSEPPGRVDWFKNGELVNQFDFTYNTTHFMMKGDVETSYSSYWFSKSPAVVTRHLYPSGDTAGNYGGYHRVVNGKDVYYGHYTFTNNPPKEVELPMSGYILQEGGRDEELMYVALYGTISEQSTIDGIGTQQGAKVPDLSNTTSVSDVLATLKVQYPELWENSVTQQVVQSDGSVKEYVYVPIGTATVDTQNLIQPTTGTQTQADTAVKATDVQGIIDYISNLIGGETTPGEENTDSTTGGGSTPPIIIPSGSASALYKIYNPSQSELNSFGGWLWSSDFVDQLLKLFNDPMQAIIGLHKVYCPVTIGGSTTIKVGYLDSGVSSNYVSGQYSTIDCGSVSLAENFGNVFDYDPYTKVFIYLPFIGIQQLNTGDVMRSTINVKYQCDVLTGACLAEINVKRDGAGGTLYTYTGNCAVQYPISSGSYMGIVASLASVAGGVVGSVASGGALAPIAMGAVSGIMNAHTSIAHSGSFSGNAGAMGNKKPYLIIVRPQTELATTFPQTDGYPVNYSAIIGSCTGYIEIENCHIRGIPATDVEVAEIESLLKGGVFI